MYLKTLFLAHFLVLFTMWMKVFGQNIFDLLGIKSTRFEKLDLPSPYPWEYVWCTSVIPVILAILAMPKNNVSESFRIIIISYMKIHSLVILR